jgi:hypothetical protein
MPGSEQVPHTTNFLPQTVIETTIKLFGVCTATMLFAQLRVAVQLHSGFLLEKGLESAGSLQSNFGHMHAGDVTLCMQTPQNTCS